MEDNFEKEIKQSEQRITELITEGEINTKLAETEKQKFSQFYLDQSETALRTAALLFEISTNEEEKKHNKLQQNFETFLWAINAAYYSMFYAVNALLANRGIKIKAEQGIHKIVAQAFIYFFIKNGLLAKRLYEEFSRAQQEATELLSLEEFGRKAKLLSIDLDNERTKRRMFTYETTESIKQMTAQTSLARAKHFFETIRLLIK